MLVSLFFEAIFSISHLKQTKVYQEAIKEGREEGQQRVKIPAQLDYITLATALDLDNVFAIS